jgi:3-hydroxyisobutyrate dehydrogenase-like beta-hydroxyacid dehydrogenase
VTGADRADRPDLTGWRVGLVGPGLMGAPMARNLRAAGAEVTVCGRRPEPLAALAAEGIATVLRPSDLIAAGLALVVTCVTDTPAVEQVVTGPDGLLSAPSLPGGLLVVDMGTTAVKATQALAARVAEAGGAWVDAPVSGGQVGAEAGTLSIMAGGHVADLDRIRPLLSVLGRRLTHVGDVGAGQVAKAANQVIVGLTIGAVAEGLALARAAGVDPARVREALIGGFADSRILELHGRRMVEGDFQPGGRVVIQHKDLTQALDLAESLGLTLPATALNRALFARLIEAGDGDLDHAALIRALEGPGDQD